ncbi:hypothetical protein EPUS_03165 [Endocarpon pusillum Z07020]|uniref:Cytochrome P450 n=1 Tax=Endocarpon pusillum (strain Z07020 / HMAS-L-300199) TaxID=1263415 RepID=U1G7E2_ENDPU|nr:uncharacterized protein EPUS_03165 [Endocarpon pusillum Z07020]ERF73332.1 hypothetical protein EPUS_03165 [Endocarpon pusillum Z07020]
MGSERVLVTGPQGIKDILQLETYKFEKPRAVRAILQGILGDGLVTAEGQNHKNQRRLLQPAFKFKQIKDNYPTFWKKSLEFIDQLNNVPDTVDVVPLLSRPTLDIIGAAGFGMDFKSVAHPDNEMTKNYATGFNSSKSAQRRRLLGFLLPAWLLNILPLKRNRELNIALNTIRKTIAGLLDDRKVGLQSGETPSDILSAIMSSGVLDSEALTHECMTVEVTTDPERIRQEVRSNIASPDCELAAAVAAVDDLKYTSAVVSEALRLHAPVHMLQRIAKQKLTVSGVPCPKGTNFRISIWALNHSPGRWSSDPLKFDLDRWLLDTAGGAADLYSFNTFSHGPRACIGERFARAEMLVMIAALVGRYNVEFVGTGETVNPNPDEARIEIGVTTKFEGGLHLKLRRVDGW